MKGNREEFTALEALAEDLDVPFRFDAAVFPELGGDRSPLELRVTPEEAVDLEFSNPKRRQEWKAFYSRYSQVTSGNRLYPCGAARTHFHIDPHGNLQPCLMVTRIKYKLNGSDFTTGWEHIGRRLGRLEIDPNQACADCSKKSLCGYCPGMFDLENGSETVPSEYLCETGQNRYNKLYLR
jgi:radical SAM protein with 4Fe4S-binding SPASM domain